MALTSLYYQSKFLGSAQDFRDIVTTSRQHNEQAQITGLLLKGGTQVHQFIEGTDKNVSALFRKIQIDKRHEGVKLVFNRSVTTRVFDDWSMGVVLLSSMELNAALRMINSTSETMESIGLTHLGQWAKSQAQYA